MEPTQVNQPRDQGYIESFSNLLSGIPFRQGFKPLSSVDGGKENDSTPKLTPMVHRKEGRTLDIIHYQKARNIAGDYAVCV